MATASSVPSITLLADISRAACVSIGNMAKVAWRYNRLNVCGVTAAIDPNGRAGKCSRHVYWCYIAMPADIHREINGLVGQYKHIERARSFKPINECAV